MQIVTRFMVGVLLAVVGCKEVPDPPRTPTPAPELVSAPLKAELDAKCGSRPPFSAEWGGFNAVAQAKFDAAALAGISDQFKKFEGTEISAEAQLAFVRRLVGGYGKAANDSVLDFYFCRLENAYPDKQDELDQARLGLVTYLNAVYDVGFWQDGSFDERQQRVERTISSLALALPEFLTAQEVNAAIPKYNFTMQTSIEATITGRIAEIEGSACVGTSFQSIQVIDTRVLNGLEALRPSVGQLVVSDTRQKLAASNMLNLPRVLIQDPGQGNKQLTVKELTCLDALHEDAKEDLGAVDNTASTDEEAVVTDAVPAGQL